jgi:imidazolonepropionase
VSSPPAAASASADLTVRGIGRLLTMTGDPLADAAVVVRAGRVEWTGPESELPGGAPEAELDAGGACVVPGFVDAHTHLVFAGVRRGEFVARLAGTTYDGGGIRTTVEATAAASDDELLDLAAGRAAAALRHGTTTMEVKTGYGLSAEAELRLLRLIERLSGRTPVRLHATYLGAHVVPAGRDREEYVAEVLDTLPAAVAAGARWCDVFCDQGVFTVDEARRILTAARDQGMGLRLHAEEIARTGAAGLAAELGCASADHLEHVNDEDARAMAAAGVVGVLLPTVTLSLRSQAWGHAAVLREAGVELALATDCNPGTSWCESMPYAIQLACLAMGLSVDEAFRAATLGAAHSLRLADVGHLGRGAHGDLAVLAAEHEADLVAHLGGPAVTATVVGGIPQG